MIIFRAQDSIWFRRFSKGIFTLRYRNGEGKVPPSLCVIFITFGTGIRLASRLNCDVNKSMEVVT